MDDILPNPEVREPAVRDPGVRNAVLRIDCGECAMTGTTACDDCVVTFIVNREPGDAVVVDADEARALRSLGEHGLVPRLRHRSRKVG